MTPHEEQMLMRMRKQFRVSTQTTDEEHLRRGTSDVLAALERFAELLPPGERPAVV